MTDTDDCSTISEDDASEHSESSSMHEDREVDMDNMPIGSSIEEIETIKDNMKKLMLILDHQDVNMDNIETILQHARHANVHSQYLHELYRDCLLQSRTSTFTNDNGINVPCARNQSNNAQTMNDCNSNENILHSSNSILCNPNLHDNFPIGTTMSELETLNLKVRK